MQEERDLTGFEEALAKGRGWTNQQWMREHGLNCVYYRFYDFAVATDEDRLAHEYDKIPEISESQTGHDIDRFHLGFPHCLWEAIRDRLDDEDDELEAYMTNAQAADVAQSELPNWSATSYHAALERAATDAGLTPEELRMEIDAFVDRGRQAKYDTDKAEYTIVAYDCVEIMICKGQRKELWEKIRKDAAWLQRVHRRLSPEHEESSSRMLAALGQLRFNYFYTTIQDSQSES